jgi:hypothetical protein
MDIVEKLRMINCTHADAMKAADEITSLRGLIAQLLKKCEDTSIVHGHGETIGDVLTYREDLRQAAYKVIASTEPK